MNEIEASRGPGVSVLLDASPLLLRSAGVKNYLFYWARSLAEQAGRNALSLFPFLNGVDRFCHLTSVIGPVATASRLGLLYAAKISPIRILNWLTPACGIFHASHQVLHPPRKARLTSTIYDMTCWLMPEVHAPANVKASGRIASALFRPASGLIAISESTRADAVRLLGLAPERIDVIHPGIAPAFFQAQKAPAGETARRYGLLKPYALYVGSIEPRKNLGTLLEAWLDLTQDVREAFDLAVVGPWGWG